MGKQYRRTADPGPNDGRFALPPKLRLLDEPFGMLDLWPTFRITTLMATHDVDESIFLSDRVVMMTDGSEADVGGILRIPFERPHDRAAVLADPGYYVFRQHLVTFLNDRSHIRPSRDPGFRPGPDLAAEYALHAHRNMPPDQKNVSPSASSNSASGCQNTTASSRPSPRPPPARKCSAENYARPRTPPDGAAKKYLLNCGTWTRRSMAAMVVMGTLKNWSHWLKTRLELMSKLRRL